MCCQSIHTAGIQQLVMDVKACACGASGACQTQCATEYCMTGMVTTQGDACDMCIQNSLIMTAADGGLSMGPCYTQVLGACQGNTDCTAYLNCSQGCPSM
jgi:hypothetical protein